MISTRVMRGAVKTHVFIRNTIKNYNTPQVKRSVRFARASALTFIALRMVTLPIPMTPSVAKAAEIGQESEPPSTQRLYDASINAVTFTPSPTAENLTVVKRSLEDVQVGKSLATQQAEEQQQKKAVLAKAKAAAAAKRTQQARLVQPVAIAYSNNEVIEQIRQAVTATFGPQHVQAALNICMRESGCNPNAINRSSGAYGMWQALPGSKMGGFDVQTQIRWGMGYLKGRYGNPTSAWNFWLQHHWY